MPEQFQKLLKDSRKPLCYLRGNGKYKLQFFLGLRFRTEQNCIEK